MFKTFLSLILWPYDSVSSECPQSLSEGGITRNHTFIALFSENRVDGNSEMEVLGACLRPHSELVVERVNSHPGFPCGPQGHRGTMKA